MRRLKAKPAEPGLTPACAWGPRARRREEGEEGVEEEGVKGEERNGTFLCPLSSPACPPASPPAPL